MTFIANLGAIEVLCRFKSVLEGKAGKKIPDSLRPKLFEFFSANNFVLSDREKNNNGPLKRGVIADLTLLTPLAISQKSETPQF